jgi:hypothetical protein
VTHTLGDLLPLAFGVSLSPFQVMALIPLLMSGRARLRGLLFLIGWFLAMAVVAALILMTPGLHPKGGEPPPAAGWLRLAVGILLLGLAVRGWRARPRVSDPPPPAWMTKMKGLSPLRALGVGALLVVNPKVLLLVVAGIATVAQTPLPLRQEVILSVIFIVLASTTVIAPVVAYLGAEGWTRERLARVERRLVQYGSVVTTAVVAIIGVALIGKAIDVLT